MRLANWRALTIYHSRENGFIVNVIVTGDLPGIVAIHFDDFREVIIDGIKGEILIFAPGYCFFKASCEPSYADTPIKSREDDLMVEGEFMDDFQLWG